MKYSYLVIDQMIDKYKRKGNFTNDQLREIRKGIEAGIDVSIYANENISSKEMFDKRWELIHKFYRNEIKKRRI